MCLVAKSPSESNTSLCMPLTMHVVYVCFALFRPIGRTSDFSISKEGLEAEAKVWDELCEICTQLAPQVATTISA
jgi:hypothetical protein